MSVQDYYRHHLVRFNSRATDQWAVVSRHYAGRAYHNLAHLQEMIDHLHAAPGGGPRPLRPHYFALCLIYHDLIYRAGRSDNEAKSATALQRELAAINAKPDDQAYCRRLIMATKRHVPSSPKAADEALLIDLDLAVLARPRKGYLQYARAVRREFNWFPGIIYRRGRRKALSAFLAREEIYQTAYFREQMEAAARTNLRYELEQLRV